ncbi:MAG TPA: peptide chain release factor 2, partial [Polyangiaceae bacterium]
MSAAPKFWDNQEKAQALMRKRASATEKLVWIEALTKDVTDAVELLELGASDNDEAIMSEVEAQVPALEERVRKVELQR